MSEEKSEQKIDRRIKLKANDDVVIDVKLEAAKLSNTLKYLLEDCEDLVGGDDDTPIPLPQVDSRLLGHLIAYLDFHVEDNEREYADIVQFDAKFLHDTETLWFDLMMAANYMDIPPMIDLISKKLAEQLTKHSVDEIRDIFKIDDDFSEEEKRQMVHDDEWCESHAKN